MQCYSELVPPSGVTHALSLSFTSPQAENLVVARTSLLQIFRCQSSNAGQGPKLVLVAEFNLAGTVTSLGRVKLLDSKSGGDAILIAFRDAKLSLVEWDPELHSISTLSIHYYENHDLSAPWQPDLAECVSHLTIDPSSRCAAFNFGISNLAIIPFLQAGDDLAMDDDDLDGDGEDKPSINGQIDGPLGGAESSPNPSFVLPLTVLDPGLLHPIDLAFLYEYRDPTIGILYSTAARSSNMSGERRDVTIYAVYALDLEQKASTTLQSVQKLPNDLYRIIPLPLPVGGALLIGSNEFIHIDQGGKTSSIAVNEFAKEASSFSMTDQSEARIRLEGCQVEHLGNAAGDMLVILRTGETALLTFRMDGRSVSGLYLRRLVAPSTEDRIKGAASCTANLGKGGLFVGSEEGDSALLGRDRKPAQLKRTRSRAQDPANGIKGEEDGDEDDDDMEDDDDLYADISGNQHASGDGSAQNFRIMDRLPSIAPINDLVIGNLGKRKREETDSSGHRESSAREVAVTYGRGDAGGIAFMSQQFEPEVTKRIKYNDAIGIWCFSSTTKPRDYRHLDDRVMVSHMTADGVGRSSLFRLSGVDMRPIVDTDFDESAGSAISVFKLQATDHTIQVLHTEVRVYDADFGLSQIFPVVDEEEGQLARAVKAAFAEPYLALIKDDDTLVVLKADKAGELDEVGLPPTLESRSVISMSLYDDSCDFFQTTRLYGSAKASAGPIMTVLSSDGKFLILSLPNTGLQIFQCDSLPFLPTYLLQDLQIPKHWRNKDDLADALLVDIGDAFNARPYLVVRNTTNDIVIYEPFALPNVVGSFKFKKVATKPAAAPEDTIEEEGEDVSLQPMQVITDLAGHATVFMPGACPMLILREASTMPHTYELRTQNIKSLSSINSSISPHGFVFIDDSEHICFSSLPQSLMLGHSDWLINRIPLGEDVTSLTYFAPTDSYIFGTNEATPFQLPQDDEWHPEWQSESTSFLPTTLQSSLKLLSSKSHQVISQYHFDYSERILCVKSLSLEVSEETRERKDLVVVGTAVVKGENVTARGNLYIFDVVDVVPEPTIPETDLKLKLITKEDVRGALSAISGVGSQGFLLAAQGQKCMVRGLKEDMSILPVAFLDMRYYVHVARELPGSGLCILGDAFSGLWLVGYSEEPYKLQVLGRDLENPSVVAADFLPDGKQLYIVSVDEDGVMRVLQYDPENPKTERGAKLLLRSTFHTGTIPTTVTLLPPSPRTTPSTGDKSMDIDTSSSAQSHSLLLASQSGSLSLLTPLSEPSYRRLSTLQNILLSSTLDSNSHFASLNPRAYRQVETDGVGGRGIIDGDLVRRWWEVGSQQKANAADKAGGDVWDVRGDLAVVGGSALGV